MLQFVLLSSPNFSNVFGQIIQYYTETKFLSTITVATFYKRTKLR